MNNKLLHTDVLITDEISDQDTRYGNFNIKKKRYEPRYKYVRNGEDLTMNDYVPDFKMLPTSIVFVFDDPNDQIVMCNKMITYCKTDHAPIKKVKFTPPPAPWMKNPEPVTAKKHLEHLRSLKKANETDGNTFSDYQKLNVRCKTLIKTIKRSLLQNALNSKKCKEVWDTVNHISIHQITASPSCGKDNEQLNESEILQLLNRIPDSNAFLIKYTTYNETQKIILNLTNDCSSGHDNIHVKFLKPVVDQIPSPVVHIVNTSTDMEIFPYSLKVAHVCPIPKTENPLTAKNFRAISI